MGKRDKHSAKRREASLETQSNPSAPSAQQPHPPKKHPVWLAISIILFLVWIVFLCRTAVFG